MHAFFLSWFTRLITLVARGRYSFITARFSVRRSSTSRKTGRHSLMSSTSSKSPLVHATVVLARLAEEPAHKIRSHREPKRHRLQNFATTLLPVLRVDSPPVRNRSERPALGTRSRFEQPLPKREPNKALRAALATTAVRVDATPNDPNSTPTWYRYSASQMVPVLVLG